MEELKRQLQPKRVLTHDAGDAHEMIAEVDNRDLSVHHRESTRVQNRRNVALGSLHDQQSRRKCCDVSEEEFERRNTV